MNEQTFTTGWTTEPLSIAQIYADTIGLVVSSHNRFLKVPGYIEEAIQTGYVRTLDELDRDPEFLSECSKIEAAKKICNRGLVSNEQRRVGQYESLDEYNETLCSMPKARGDIRREARHADKRIDLETALKMVYQEFCENDDTYLWAYYAALTDATFEDCGRGQSNINTSIILSIVS